MLSKSERLTTKEIEGLSLGKSVFGTLVSLRFVESKRSKFAVSVSKKTLAGAVERNRVRRRVYVALAALKKDIQRPVFVMLMPKKEFLSAPIDVLVAEIRTVFRKAGLVK